MNDRFSHIIRFLDDNNVITTPDGAINKRILKAVASDSRIK